MWHKRGGKKGVGLRWARNTAVLNWERGGIWLLWTPPLPGETDRLYAGDSSTSYGWTEFPGQEHSTVKQGGCQAADARSPHFALGVGPQSTLTASRRKNTTELHFFLSRGYIHSVTSPGFEHRGDSMEAWDHHYWEGKTNTNKQKACDTYWKRTEKPLPVNLLEKWCSHIDV